MGSGSTLNIQEDGVIVYDGSHNGMDNIFPSDGVIRIKKAPEAVADDTPEKIQEMINKHNCPITKQRVILKPQKLKLPVAVDILDDENFSDVIYDSDAEKEKEKAKDKAKMKKKQQQK